MKKLKKKLLGQRCPANSQKQTPEEVQPQSSISGRRRRILSQLIHWLFRFCHTGAEVAKSHGTWSF
jgi:hypothetical protein